MDSSTPHESGPAPPAPPRDSAWVEFREDGQPTMAFSTANSGKEENGGGSGAAKTAPFVGMVYLVMLTSLS